MDGLGQRLRKAGVSEDDWLLLEDVLNAYQGVMDVVQSRLEFWGLAPTSRVKSIGTLIEKLDRGTSFKSVQDVAGIRIVVDGLRADQDLVVDRIVAEWPSRSRVIDRRDQPNHGYRAVHVIVVEDGMPVEIQVRTALQDMWAQTMERLADRWGRGLRYGEPLTDGGAELAPDFTKDDLLEMIDDLADLIDDLERRSGEQDQGEVSFQGLNARFTSLFASISAIIG